MGSLCAGFKARPLVLDASLDWQVVAELKVKCAVLGLASPVATKESLALLKAQGGGHDFVVGFGHKRHDQVFQVFFEVLEE